MSVLRGEADICLILEGTYPYVVGGVSAWVHDLIESLPELSFSLVCVQPRHAELTPKYNLPKNVRELVNVRLQELPKGTNKVPDEFFPRIKAHVQSIQAGEGRLSDLKGVLNLLRKHPDVGYQVLLNSEQAWKMMLEIYEESQPESSFIDFFWSWRALMGGFFSLLLADMPKAKIYHSISTGFAGALAARMHVEKNIPSLLTEHGIYTNERRIEISMADWIEDEAPVNLGIHHNVHDLRSLWMNCFASYAHMCYEASNPIITLFSGNQKPQMEGGADPRRLKVIPNGIDFDRFSAVSHQPAERPTVAFIGRVVPIKDVKTFIRACAMVRKQLPNLDAYIIGPTDEDPDYFNECKQLATHLMLDNTIEFTGKVVVEDYLPKVDLVVMTSISEAQPLVLLEAGAAGIPSVVTDVGACRELVLGADSEEPPLGHGGAVTGLASASETAAAMIDLLTNAEHYAAASKNIRRRVQTYYRKEQQIGAYRDLYRSLISKHSSDYKAA
jgi:glycosyltransferase involved in cell wall biosynthesis